uniref:Uncharacterized protein n=1 Tax=Anguilla anguilla TaxID=7936 RepID=A0A0E9XBS5_ANGAN
MKKNVVKWSRTKFSNNQTIL